MFIKQIMPLIVSALFLSTAAAEEFDSEKHKRDVETYRKSLETAPQTDEVERDIAHYYLTLGKERIRQGRYEEALEILEKGESNSPEKRAFIFYRGLAYHLLKRSYEAESELLKVAYENGGDPEALKLLGRIYYDRTDLPAAIRAWERAMEIAPEDKELARLIAKARREARVEQKMTTAYTGRFLVQYDGERDEAIGRIVVEVLEDAYNTVGVDLDHFPEGDIPVILYTKRDFKEITESPDWAGGLYDGKIRVPVGGLKETTDELKALLYHEYTHVVIGYVTKGRCPQWLNEGLAIFEESRFIPVHQGVLREAARDDKLIPLSRLGVSFTSLKGKKARLAYEESYSFVKYLIDNYGIFRLADVLSGLSGGRPVSDVISGIYKGYNLKLEDLIREWRASLL